MIENNKLYTFLLEYKGGTYISQIEANSNKSALVKWSETLDVSEIKGIGEKLKEQLKDSAKIKTPSLLQGLSNVWCVTFFLAGSLALVNFVKTETD